ncbi:MAG: TPD domain-containing protein [Candidatus Hodarchaeota archaeon]
MVFFISVQGLKFIKLCQKIVQDSKRNFWKLKKQDLSPNINIISLSRKLKVAPVLIIREILKNRGNSRNSINQILRKEISAPSELEDLIKIACRNDPVYSPLGLKLSRVRGQEGEKIIKLWLESKGLKFERDLGSGISFPDFLLEKPIKIFEKSVIWIESKCYFGDKEELQEDEEQFKRFDSMGEGVIIYWFGFEKKSKHFMLSGEDFKKLLPSELKLKVDELLNFIPKEFIHLLD